MSLLYQHGPVLAPDLRRTIVQSLLLLRNRNVTEAAALLPLLFHLFQIPDKDLRVLMYSHVVADVKRVAPPEKHRPRWAPHAPLPPRAFPPRR